MSSSTFAYKDMTLPEMYNYVKVFGRKTDLQLLDKWNFWNAAYDAMLSNVFSKFNAAELETVQQHTPPGSHTKDAITYVMLQKQVELMKDGDGPLRQQTWKTGAVNKNEETVVVNKEGNTDTWSRTAYGPKGEATSAAHIAFSQNGSAQASLLNLANRTTLEKICFEKDKVDVQLLRQVGQYVAGVSYALTRPEADKAQCAVLDKVFVVNHALSPENYLEDFYKSEFLLRTRNRSQAMAYDSSGPISLSQGPTQSIKPTDITLTSERDGTMSFKSAMMGEQQKIYFPIEVDVEGFLESYKERLFAGKN